MLINN